MATTRSSSAEVDGESPGVDGAASGRRPALEAALDQLQERNPTNYGYLRQHVEEVCRGIERSDRSYPNAKQLHAELSAPDSTPRALGAALKALESLGVIGIWSDSVGSNRYDLTEYDSERVELLTELLAERA